MIYLKKKNWNHYSEYIIIAKTYITFQKFKVRKFSFFFLLFLKEVSYVHGSISFIKNTVEPATLWKLNTI